MNKKVVVFGGSGFLGSHVADTLTEKGYEVVIFDIQTSAYLRDGQKMVVGDVLDADAVGKVIEGARYVYNFSGIADLDSATTMPLSSLRINVEGTLNILEACRKHKVERFIFASSIYVYSDKGGFYRCSKQAAEIYIEEFQRKYDVDFTILRYGTLYGPRATESNSVYRYVSQALQTGKITVPGDGEEMREYIHVKDAAELSFEILDPKYKNKHFIITGHHPLKLKQLLLTIEEILGRKIEIIYQPGTNPHHYTMTPYSYLPKLGQKLTSNCYTDIGQGLLDCFQDIHKH
jgi:UDP-glucose 4-epimerase